MTAWNATAKFVGGSTFKVVGRGKLYSTAVFAATSTFKIIARGKWFAEAVFAGTSALNASTRKRWASQASFAGTSAVKIVARGRWYISAKFAGSSRLRLIGRAPWHATAQFIGASALTLYTAKPSKEFINMPAAVVSLETFNDADYALTYQWVVNDVPFDFTDHAMQMMVRRVAEDEEVFLQLDSSITGIPVDQSGIDIYQSIVPGPYNKFDLIITRNDLAEVPAGDYVHSLILIRPDGLRQDIWRGTLTHAIGPTR